MIKCALKGLPLPKTETANWHDISSLLCRIGMKTCEPLLCCKKCDLSASRLRKAVRLRVGPS